MPAFGPATARNVTVFPAVGVPPSWTVAVRVYELPLHPVPVSGAREMSLMTVTPRARMYGVPTEPSVAANDEPTPRAIARTCQSTGQASKASCTEQLQFERKASVSPVNAGCVATTWASFQQSPALL